jgi:hypothetical protein
MLEIGKSEWLIFAVILMFIKTSTPQYRIRLPRN